MPAENRDPLRNVHPTTELLMRVRRQDRSALDDLLERYQSRMVEWARREGSPLVRGQFETMDSVQDVALTLIQYLPNIELTDSDAFQRLLYTMIRNSVRGKVKYLTAARRQIARVQPIADSTVLRLDPHDPDARSPDAVLSDEEEKGWVRLAIALLGPDDQELILRHELDGTTFVELGEELGLSPDATRMRCRRATARLAEAIERLRSGDLERVLAEPR